MRAIVGAVVASAALLVAGTAVAGPCDDAERGTYLCNVCWLFEDLHETVLHEADETTCTAVSHRRYRDWFNLVDPGAWVTRRVEVRFNRVNLTDSTVKRHLVLRNLWCAELRGEGVASVNGVDKDYTVFCGEKSRERVRAAVENLYAKYCTGRRSEF